MLRTPDEEDIPVRHRPLPSVDIALLPHELRAIRMQRRAIAGGAVAVVLIGLALVYGKSVWAHLHAAHDKQPWGADGEPPRDGKPASGAALVAANNDHASEATVAAHTASAGAGTRVERKFGRAKSFRDALTNNGASPSEADELIDVFDKLIDFRHGKPEDTFIFERDANGQLRKFEYHASITEVYRAVPDGHGHMRGVRVDIPIEQRRIAKGTYIAGSLGHSLTALGLGAQLVGVVTEAFDTRISFTKDTRVGDSVKLIVDEEYVDGNFLRYGAVHAIEYTSERAGKLQAFWFESDRKSGEFYDGNGRALHGGWIRTPLRYDHISSPYNLKRRHPILKRIMPHLGIDYSAATGTPVWAAADGTVTFTGKRGANGNLVSLRHANGYESHYAHLWRINTGIRPGVKVKQHQVIGYVGSTGRSTGPHLHFAVKRFGHFLDPATLLSGPGGPLPSALMPRFRSLAQRLRTELEHIPLAPAPSVDEAAVKPEDTADDEDIDL